MGDMAELYDQWCEDWYYDHAGPVEYTDVPDCVEVMRTERGVLIRRGDGAEAWFPLKCSEMFGDIFQYESWLEPQWENIADDFEVLK